MKMTNREYKKLLKERYKSWQEEKIGIHILSKEEVEELKKKGIIKDKREKNELYSEFIMGS